MCLEIICIMEWYYLTFTNIFCDFTRYCVSGKKFPLHIINHLQSGHRLPSVLLFNPHPLAVLHDAHQRLALSVPLQFWHGNYLPSLWPQSRAVSCPGVCGDGPHPQHAHCWQQDLWGCLCPCQVSQHIFRFNSKKSSLSILLC